MGRKEDLIEANRRGLLTGQLKSDFDAAVTKGLITLPSDSFRKDRTLKGTGFLGPLSMTDGLGRTMTEFSVGVF